MNKALKKTPTDNWDNNQSVCEGPLKFAGRKDITIVTKSGMEVKMFFEVPDVNCLSNQHIKVLGIQPTFDGNTEVEFETTFEGGIIEKFLMSFGFAVIEVFRNKFNNVVAVIGYPSMDIGR
ncbi:MAG TPA: hypothetical protein PK771_05740 [Spirochaetota bacterium]|nr:hypothetical protein [Spirochaetota bacterium]